jgi:hypothetical protein
MGHSGPSGSAESGVEPEPGATDELGWWMNVMTIPSLCGRGGSVPDPCQEDVRSGEGNRCEICRRLLPPNDRDAGRRRRPACEEDAA